MCIVMCMRTNIVIDQELMTEAQKLAGLKAMGKPATMRETVDLALREFVSNHKRLGILELRGKFPNWGKFDDDLPDL